MSDKSNKEINGIGSGIMDAVDDAVNRGDFSGLSDAIRKTVLDMTGSAAGTAADAMNSFQGFVQGTSGNAAGGKQPNQAAGQKRTYGHAGYAEQNVTEQYMQRAAGARHHTTYASKISPFLQRRIGRTSGIGRIVGGITCLVMAGFSLLDSIFSGLMGLFSTYGSGFFSAMGITSLVFTLGLGILGAVLVKKGTERRRLVKEYYEYGRIAGTGEYLEINKLARATGQTREQVLDNLEKMISEDMLPAAWFDKQKTTLMLSERMYNEYLRLERERQEQQAEEAKAKMKKKTMSGAVDASDENAFAYADADLRPKPEDAKLPADARKIVEEGLLYMGRIREANRAIGDAEISDELSRLEITMNRIIEQIRKDPSSAPNLRRLMVYYLPTTMKLLQAYIELDRQPMAGENIISTKQEIREALGTINIAFENLLDSLFQDMAWDISSDISVMKTMMAQDGLTGEGIRKASQAAAQSSPEEYTDGYTDELTEAGQAAYGSAQTAAGQEEESGGIRLKFGK
jgi:hypothetical protein